MQKPRRVRVEKKIRESHLHVPTDYGVIVVAVIELLREGVLVLGGAGILCWILYMLTDCD